jgi:prepilin-type N-terminal cleavage/methylation domain-containing protein
MLTFVTPGRRAAFSLVELLAVVAIVATLALLLTPRASGSADASKKAACQTIRRNIEVQAELWLRHTGAWPAANLSNIGSDLNYFPSGVSTCPVDGTAYTIDAAGRVVGHNH